MSLKSFSTMVRLRIREHIFLLSLFHLLEKIGVKITLYYITQEAFSEELEISVRPTLKPLVSGFLSVSEIEKMYSHPEIKHLAPEIHSWSKDNCLCFALRHNEDLLAYSWCNLRHFHSEFSSFDLNDDEAYIFRSRTLSAYRGENLAPFLRCQLYKSLGEMGRTKFFSITEYFNIPADNFKKKLKARHIKLCFYLGLFNKRLFNLTLKKY
jgi:hypothetical protein